MSEIWMALRPGVRGTRILAMNSSGTTVLKARLSVSPSHPRALSSLLEAMALWEGITVRAVLVADDDFPSSGTTLFRECWSDFGRLPLYELAYTRATAHDEGGDEIGALADLRELLLPEAG
ncbi:MAG: hypothetical protein AAGA56_06755 [Myxococcota bacterium]